MRNLRNLTFATEILMLGYWIITILMAIGLIYIDPAWLYSDYKNPLMNAWNWSFLPLDLCFIVLGFSARFLSMPKAKTEKFELIAATLMFCAGLMAISFWLIIRDFNWTWWLANLWLIILGSANVYVRT